MIKDRREFLVTAGTLGVASLVMSEGVLAQILSSLPAGPSREDYTARLKEWFYLYNADASQQGDLKLVKIKELGSTEQLEQFALLLRSRRGATAMPSGYYEVSGESFCLHIKHTYERNSKQNYIAEFALLQ